RGSMGSDDDLAAGEPIDPILRHLRNSRPCSEQEDPDLGIGRVMPPECGHDIGTRGLLLDCAPEEAKAPIDIFAVGRDECRFAVGRRKIRIALKPIEVIGIEGEEYPFVQLLDDLRYGQAIDPCVQDPGTMPVAPAGAPRLNVGGHQRPNIRATTPLRRGRPGASSVDPSAVARIISIVRSVAAAEAKSFRCCSALPLIARPNASSCALY